MNEGKYEADREQHRCSQMDIALPQGEDPVIHLECRRHRDDQCRRRKEEAEVRIHATDVHVVRPHDEAESTDRDNRPDHHAITEDIFARMRTQQIGNDAECRQGNDINLWVTEEPEQMLEQDWAAAGVARIGTHRTDRRHKKAGHDGFVEHHHDGADQQCRECQQAKNRGHEDAPDRQRHAHQRHAFTTRL